MKKQQILVLIFQQLTQLLGHPGKWVENLCLPADAKIVNVVTSFGPQQCVIYVESKTFPAIPDDAFPVEIPLKYIIWDKPEINP